MPAAGGLDSNQLRYLARRDRRLAPYFLGVFPANGLPRITRRPAGLIVNSDLADEPGTHWLAMYFGPDDDNEFFDSYGQRPATYDERWTTTVLRPDYLYSTRRLQGNQTTVCGHYCYYYLAQRFRGHSLAEIVQRFPGPSSVNDRWVCHWVTRQRSLPRGRPYCQTSVCGRDARRRRRRCSTSARRV